jgi:biopolymer transport protein ExbD
MMAVMQETQDEHGAQFQNETESVKVVMKANARRFAQFQNVMDVMKTIKAGGGANTLLGYSN